MGISTRLKEERERLGLSQTALAEKAGVTKKSQINWEQGIAMPNAGVLAAYSVVGVDVLYVLTGQRGQPTQEMEMLPPDERIMLDNYRHAPPAVQAGVKTTLGAFAPATGRSKNHKPS